METMMIIKMVMMLVWTAVGIAVLASTIYYYKMSQKYTRVYDNMMGDFQTEKEA